MTTLARPNLGTPGPAPLRLIRSEFVKVRTTNAWWLFILGALATQALAFLINAFNAHFFLNQPTPPGLTAEQAAQIDANRDVVLQAANLYTSGQFFGVMFVMLFGIVLVTSEFYHQTATITFLTTPRRTAVILAKLVAAVLFGAGLWAITTGLNLPATTLFLRAEDFPSQLDAWPVQRAILLNLLAYVIWGILGVGIGVLIRSQIAATIIAVLAYTVGTAVVQILTVLANQFKQEWIEDLQWGVPSIASMLMVSGGQTPGMPPWWVGALVLLGYAVVAGVIGILITRRRDIA